MVRDCLKKEIDLKIIATAISLCDKPRYLILNQDTVDALEDLESIDSRVVGQIKLL